MKNILIASNLRFDKFNGGMEMATYNLVNVLLDSGKYNLIIAFTEYKTEINNKNFKFQKVLFTKESDLDILICKHDIHLVIFPGGPWYCTLFSQKKHKKIKVITCWHFDPLFVDVPKRELCYNLPLIKNIRQNFIVFFKKKIYLILNIYERFINFIIFRRAVHKSFSFILLSKNHINIFKKKYFLTSSDNIKAIANINTYPLLDLDQIDLILKEKKKSILVVSRLDDKIKNISLVLKVWSLIELKYPEWNLNIIGHGKDENLLKEQSKKYKLNNVNFLGKLNPEKYYIESSILLSTTYTEGWGLNIVEAQQYGCVPIVLNDYLSLSEIISDQNGINCKGDVSYFINILERLIIDDVARSMYAKNAIINSSRFDKINIANLWFNLIDSALGEI